MIRTFLLAATTLAATPAFAHGNAPASHQAGDAVPVGCVRVHAFVPAGKIAHAPAPIRCAANVTAAAAHARQAATAPRFVKK